MRHARPAILIGTALLAAYAVATPPATASPTRDENRAYVAGDGLTVECGSASGGGCFDLTGSEVSVVVRISDLGGSIPTAGRYQFRDAAGELTGSGAFCDKVTVEVPSGAARLEVLVPAADPVTCLPAGLSATATGSIRALFDLSPGGPAPDVDVERQDCLQAAPASWGVPGLTDEGQSVDLDVLVLLDGVSRERGVEIMKKAAEAYAPLDIVLVPSFRPVKLSAEHDDELIGQARDAVGGTVPQGMDVVLALTSKQNRGQADCIGGIRFPDRAFAVTPDHEDRPINVVGDITLGMIHDRAAMTAAHEIGHLLGGQHHDGNCLELPENCTLMSSPAVKPATRIFSKVNAAIVRGHAVAYATP